LALPDEGKVGPDDNVWLPGGNIPENWGTGIELEEGRSGGLGSPWSACTIFDPRYAVPVWVDVDPREITPCNLRYARELRGYLM